VLTNVIFLERRWLRHTLIAFGNEGFTIQYSIFNLHYSIRFYPRKSVKSASSALQKNKQH